MKRVWGILSILLGLSISADSAFAYIDPASGSMSSQLILVGFAILAVAMQGIIRKYLSKIKHHHFVKTFVSNQAAPKGK